MGLLYLYPVALCVYASDLNSLEILESQASGKTRIWWDSLTSIVSKSEFLITAYIPRREATLVRPGFRSDL